MILAQVRDALRTCDAAAHLGHASRSGLHEQLWIGMETAPDVYLHWMLTYVHQAGIELICDRFVQRIDGAKGC